MTNNEYLKLSHCYIMTDLYDFCREVGIQTEHSYNPHEHIVTLSRNGDSVTKTIPSHIACGDGLVNCVKEMIMYLLGGEPLIKPDKVLVAARGSGKSQFVREYFKALTGYKDLAIKNVIFNDPATIIFWTDGTKTVVKAENEPFDPEKGLAMAMSKKFLGNKGNYFNEFKKWLPEKEEKKTTVKKLCIDITADVAPVIHSTIDELSAKFKTVEKKVEVNKTCINCKNVKPFNNPVCDKCVSADKFEAKEEKDD